MGDLQPGVGYNVISSPQGDSLEILFPSQNQNPLIQQLQVKINGSRLKVAKGNVLYRSTPGYYYGGCLRQYNINGFAVWPNDQAYAGDDGMSDWVDQDGYVNLLSPDDEGGHSAYGVYIIANHYRLSTGLSPSQPYLAVMPVGGDAETKTKPWGDETSCDGQRWMDTSQRTPVVVQSVGPPPWYEPFDISGFLELGAESRKLYNYNCQRVHVATVEWDATTKFWNCYQHLYGPITIPYNIFYGGRDFYDPYGGDPEPSWYSTPFFSTNQSDYENDYTDCQKWGGTGTSPTIEVDL